MRFSIINKKKIMIDFKSLIEPSINNYRAKMVDYGVLLVNLTLWTWDL